MKIQERFSNMFPNAKVYWNGNINQLSLHFEDNNIDTFVVKIKIMAELDRIGLVNAVENIVIYQGKNMKLYDLLQIKEDCIDTGDNIYDAIVTVDLIEDEDVEDNYDRFVNYLLHNVEVVDAKKNICDWTGFIKSNMEALKAFTKEYWVHTYENNEDEFIYQWINELHLYCAGYTSENVYKAFLDTFHEQKIYNLASKLVNYAQSYTITIDFYDYLYDCEKGIEIGKTEAETIRNMASRLYDKTFCKAVYDYILEDVTTDSINLHESLASGFEVETEKAERDIIDRKSVLLNELQTYMNTLDEVQLNKEKDIDICE